MPENKTPDKSIFSHSIPKLFLFLVSYILSVTVVVFLSSNQGTPSFGDFTLALFLFPAGFGWPIFPLSTSNDSNMTFSIGWLTYLVITIFAVFIKTRHVAR